MIVSMYCAQSVRDDTSLKLNTLERPFCGLIEVEEPVQERLRAS